MNTKDSAFLEQEGSTFAESTLFVHSEDMCDDQWARCRLEGETDSQLFQRLQKLVRTIAGFFAKKVPASISCDDLVQEGWIGLLDAVKRYSVQEGASFETYAGRRIRGAILDALRAYDHVIPSMRKLVRQAEHIRNCLTHSLQREPTPREWQEALPEDVRDMFWEIVAHLESPLVSLVDVDVDYCEIDAMWKGGKGMSVEDELIAHEEQDPSKGLSPRIQAALRELTNRQRCVLYWRYQVPVDETLSQEVLGGEFHASKSYVCHLEAQALRKLRGHLHTRWDACL